MNNKCCAVCGKSDSQLFRCSQCKSVCYCSKEHQRQDWKLEHRSQCVRQGDIGKNNAIAGTSRAIGAPSNSDKQKKTASNRRTYVATGNASVEKLGKRNGTKTNAWDGGVGLFTDQGSSENEILNARTETLVTDLDLDKHESKEELRGFAKISLEGGPGLGEQAKGNILESVSVDVVRDMDAYGVCVVDHFLGPDMGGAVLDEVVDMYQRGVFKDGQTVSATGDVQNIRRDKIAWLDGKESQYKNIGELITKVDTVIQQANKMLNNGKMGSYVINGRTKAMVACYPAQGSHYVKHVDNPNHDGRCITAIYYLNTDWDVQRDGGLLRIFPQGWQDQVANIEPLFDRILFFWSDRRNPHEVQPSFRTRYAITLWYFDANEREEATKKHHEHRQQQKAQPTQLKSS